MNKIKVLHITYDMRIGGGEMVIKNIVENSNPDKIESAIFCIEEPLGPWGELLKSKGLAIFSKQRKQGFDTSMIGAIRRVINDCNIDIVHCHQYTPWVYGALATIGIRSKVIFTEHGRFYPDIKHPKRRWVNPVLLGLTKHVSAISKATANALAEYEYVPAKRTQVIYNGISTRIPLTQVDKRAELGLSQNTFLLGNIARFDPIKNHTMMLHSVKQMIDNNLDVHLLLVGDGECREQIQTLIEKLNISNHVTLTGYIVDPSEYMHAMDVFLLTSYSEGTSMTLLEAMRQSKVCVVTNVGGNPEVIEHNHNGLVIPSDNSKELTKAVELLITNPDMLQNMKSNAKKRFERMFSANTMCEEYQKLYESC